MTGAQVGPPALPTPPILPVEPRSPDYDPPHGETEWEAELRGPWEVAGEDWREKGTDRRRTSLQCNVTVLGQDPLLHWVTSQLSSPSSAPTAGVAEALLLGL